MAPSNPDEVLWDFQQVLQQVQEVEQHLGDVAETAEDGADAVEEAQTVEAGQRERRRDRLLSRSLR